MFGVQTKTTPKTETQLDLDILVSWKTMAEHEVVHGN